MTNTHNNSEVRDMSSEDFWLLDRLQQSPGCDEGLLDAVLAWWQERAPELNLMAFLATEGIMTMAQAQLWGEQAEGTGIDSDTATARVFTPAQLQLLTRRIVGSSSTQTTAPALQGDANLRSSGARERIRRYVASASEQSGHSPQAKGPEVGDTLGKCTLMTRLGSGSTCTVFAALHRTLRITVAVKIFRLGERRGRSVDHTVFRHEAQLLARMNDPRIVRILDFEDGEQPYLILEFVDGMTVLDLIDANGPIDPEEAMRIVIQTAKGLRSAHNFNVIHRDIKPANILLDQSGNVKLADLGMATLSAQLQRDLGETPTAVLCGTPAYVAPEVVVDAAAASEHSDVYSLGASLYHMLTARYPFVATNVEMMLLGHLRERPTPPCEVVPEVSKYLSNIVMAMLEKDPAKRPKSMDEVIEALELALQWQLAGRTTSSISTRIRRRLLLLLNGEF